MSNKENKYLTIIPADKYKDILKKYEELWSKIRDLIKSITNTSDNYDEEFMKIKHNLPLKKTLALFNVAIVVRFVFHDRNKYYS